MSLPIAQALAMTDTPGQSEQAVSTDAQPPANLQPTSPGIAAQGTAGPGVADSFDRVVLRNSLIGLAAIGLMVFSAMNEME